MSTPRALLSGHPLLKSPLLGFVQKGSVNETRTL